MFGDLAWEVEVDITGEAVDRQAVMTTLTTVLQTLASNPAILQDPKMKLIFNKILVEVGGISPIELSQTDTTPVAPTAPVAPQGGQVGAGMQPLNKPQPNAISQ